MKEKNLLKNKLSFITGVTLVLWSYGCYQIGGQQQANSDTLVFEGTLENLGPEPGVTNGRFAAYRLAKYRVERVCRGKYEQSQIVVDHPIFTGKEFDAVKLKDRICVTVKKSDKILVRYNADGIRNSSDEVTTFYVAEKAITRADEPCCQ